MQARPAKVQRDTVRRIDDALSMQNVTYFTAPEFSTRRAEFYGFETSDLDSIPSRKRITPRIKSTAFARSLCSCPDKVTDAWTGCP